ncbi:MAG TPA: FAD binding domain-containing protein [Bryobacteraceae bacterium]|nr:FAD binding domain-containing protein [Bryobacteraceae bacterium]
MQAFEYANPTTLQEALGLLASKWGEADVLAGGTDQISLMKDYLATPKRLVNIKGIKELGGIQSTKTGLRIGSTVTIEDLLENADVRKAFPALTDAARGVTSPQIRNMGTVGGDLCQRPRCWYYRQGFGLLAMKDGEALIPNGENRYHAILGNSGPAYFVSASSLGPALVALGAKFRLASASGHREVAAAKFFVTPQNEHTREIALLPNEILTEIIVPHEGSKNATYEVRQKQALDWPLAAASVALKMKGSTVSSARIVLGHVAPTPWAAAQAEQALAGKAVTPENAEEAAKAAVADAKPLSQNGYKVQLAKVAVKRALLEAVKARA